MIHDKQVADEHGKASSETHPNQLLEPVGVQPVDQVDFGHALAGAEHHAHDEEQGRTKLEGTFIPDTCEGVRDLEVIIVTFFAILLVALQVRSALES